MYSPTPIRTGFFLIMLCLGAVPALAQEARFEKTPCEEETRQSYVSHDKEEHCEVRTFTLPPQERLAIDGQQNGGVTVTGEERRDVRVRATVRATARSKAQAEVLAEKVRIRTEGGRIEAEGPATDRENGWAVNYEVRTPTETDLSLRAQNGGLSIKDVRGEMDLKTQNGGVALKGVGGDVRARTTNGGLSIRLSGERWRGGGLDAQTTNGGVVVYMPEGYAAQLETGTTNGSMNVEFPITVEGDIGKRLSTQLGAGGPTVRALTTNGSVSIRRADPLASDAQ